MQDWCVWYGWQRLLYKGLDPGLMCTRSIIVGSTKAFPASYAGLMCMFGSAFFTKARHFQHSGKYTPGRWPGALVTLLQVQFLKKFQLLPALWRVYSFNIIWRDHPSHDSVKARDAELPHLVLILLKSPLFLDVYLSFSTYSFLHVRVYSILTGQWWLSLPLTYRQYC